MKTLIEMARIAGVRDDGHRFEFSEYKYLERFAELVRADERRAMMQLFTDPENQPTQHGTVTLEYIQREIADEREACAKVCDDLALPPDVARSDASIWEVATLDCADAIRARSNT